MKEKPKLRVLRLLRDLPSDTSTVSETRLSSEYVVEKGSRLIRRCFRIASEIVCDKRESVAPRKIEHKPTVYVHRNGVSFVRADKCSVSVCFTPSEIYGDVTRPVIYIVTLPA